MSSGTTGEPKAIGLNMSDMEPRLRQLAISGVSTGIGQKTLVMLNFSTNLGFFMFLQSLWCGGTVFSNFSTDTGRIIADFQIDKLLGSPATIGWLVRQVEAHPVDCSSLKLVLVGGSLIPRPLANRIARILCKRVAIGYGSTEMGFLASGSLARLRNVPDGVGVIVPWIDAEVVDEEGKVVPPDVVGELRFRSEAMAQRYVNDPSASAKAFRNGWFYPGDLGAITSDRMLRVTGRKDEVINAGGVKINPSSIENALTNLHEVVDAAAFVARIDSAFEKICVAIEPREGSNDAHLRTLCHQQLKHYPAVFLIVLDKLPRNAMGKVSRQELRKIVATMERSAVELNSD